MRLNRSCWRRGALVLVPIPTAGALLCFTHAAAQSAPTNDEEARAPAAASSEVHPAIVPPRLKYASAIEVGAEAPLLAKHARVLLEVSITRAGTVAQATVLSGLDDVRNAVAIRAAQTYLFEPARADGEAIPVIIEYEIWFEATPSEPVTLGAPAAAVEREIPAEAARPPAPSPNALAEEWMVYEGVAEVAAPPREPTKRSLNADQLSETPGTGGDAVRAIETLPGVARDTQGDNPILRGSNGSESQVYLDGTPVPLLYHFGGLKSFVNSRLLERVDVYPGNFSVRYGRVTGGIVEVALRAPKMDRFHAEVELSLLDSGAFVETPLGENSGLLLAGRRSNIDFFFEQVVPEDAFEVVAAPLYWDYQAVWEYQPSPEQRFRVAAFGSRDQVEFLFSNPNKENPALRGDVAVGIDFHRVQLLHDAKLGGLRHSATVSVGVQNLDQQFGPNSKAFLDLYDLDVRGEWSGQVKKGFQLIAGIDVSGQRLEGAYVGPAAASQEGSPDAESGSEPLRVEPTTEHFLALGAYLESRLTPTARWTLVPGLRADYFHELAALTLDPRLSQRLQLSERVVLKSGVGWFSQPPLYYESLASVGNPEVDPYHALQTSAGVEFQPTPSLLLEGEGFYKRLNNRVVETEGGVPPQFTNAGTGSVIGLESFVRFTPRPGTFAQAAYTLSRSERQDRNEASRLFDSDQTHNLTLAASHQLGAGWVLGARFRFVSGNPYTPISRAVYDIEADTYVPDAGATNSLRNPSFHQLDVRLEKAFNLGAFKLTTYLDVQNVYNRENPEGFNYSYNYQQREQVSGVPFFPNLGLRGEL